MAPTTTHWGRWREVHSQYSSLVTHESTKLRFALYCKATQPTEEMGNVPASRQRRLNSGVAHATRDCLPAYRGLKPTAKFSRRSAAKRPE